MSQGQESSAGLKHAGVQKPLTHELVRDRNHQQAYMQGHRSHSLSGESETGIINRFETCRGIKATHSLMSKGQESSAGLKSAGEQKHSQTGEPGTRTISRLETCRGTEATYTLVSQGQESSAGLECEGS
jgi:hypothetical protein